MKIHLGCGTVAPIGWVNVDSAIGARLSRGVLKPFARRAFSIEWPSNIVIHDLSKRFPWPEDTADVIYSSHTLEHLSRETGEHFMAECRRVLKPGGILRIVVPDLKKILDGYQSGSIDARDLITELGAQPPWAGRKKLHQIVAVFSGSHHLCMYDEKALLALTTEHGFSCRRMQAFESVIDDIRAIEREDRAKGELVIEGV